MTSNTSEQPNATPVASQDAPVKLKDLLGQISKDKKIDGNDLAQIELLMTQFEGEKKDLLAQTKQETIPLLQESLKKGYTVRDESDYKVLTKILLLIDKNFKLPDYSQIKEITSQNDKNLFSVQYNPHRKSLGVYVREDYIQHITVNTDLTGTINLQDGTFTSAGIFRGLFNIDDTTGDNNEIDFSPVNAEDVDIGGEKKEEPQSKEPEAVVKGKGKKRKGVEHSPAEAPAASKNSHIKPEPKQKPAGAQPEPAPKEDQKSEKGNAPEKKAPKPESRVVERKKVSKNKFDLAHQENVMDESLKDRQATVQVKDKLNIRDENGKITGTLKNGETVTLTGNKKEVNGTTFVEINDKKYVALKYLKLKDVVSQPEETTSLPAKPAVAAAEAGVPAPVRVAEQAEVASFDYEDLRKSILYFNDNEKRFYFGEGLRYFGDNFATLGFSGFAVKRGREDFRVIVSPDGSFVTLNTTGIDYHDIRDKASQYHSGKIKMKGNQFDFSGVLK